MLLALLLISALMPRLVASSQPLFYKNSSSCNNTTEALFQVQFRTEKSGYPSSDHFLYFLRHSDESRDFAIAKPNLQTTSTNEVVADQLLSHIENIAICLPKNKCYRFDMYQLTAEFFEIQWDGDVIAAGSSFEIDHRDKWDTVSSTEFGGCLQSKDCGSDEALLEFQLETGYDQNLDWYLFTDNNLDLFPDTRRCAGGKKGPCSYAVFSYSQCLKVNRCYGHKVVNPYGPHYWGDIIETRDKDFNYTLKWDGRVVNSASQHQMNYISSDTFGDCSDSDGDECEKDPLIMYAAGLNQTYDPSLKEYKISTSDSSWSASGLISDHLSFSRWDPFCEVAPKTSTECFVFQDLGIKDSFVKLEYGGYIAKEKFTFYSDFATYGEIGDAIIGTECTSDQVCQDDESLLEVTFVANTHEDGSWIDCSNIFSLYSINGEVYYGPKYRSNNFIDAECDPKQPYKLLMCVPSCKANDLTLRIGRIFFRGERNTFSEFEVKVDGIIQPPIEPSHVHGGYIIDCKSSTKQQDEEDSQNEQESQNEEKPQNEQESSSLHFNLTSLAVFTVMFTFVGIAALLFFKRKVYSGYEIRNQTDFMFNDNAITT